MAKPISAKGSWVKCNVKLDGKTAIITGANTGLGYWTAFDLAERGAKVILACRNLTKADESRNKIIAESKCSPDKIVVKQIDLKSFQSIREFADDINTNETRLDILINNAGVMLCPFSRTEDGYETHFGVNHLGHFLLTNLLLDLLKKSAPSRIVVVSSIAYILASMNWSDLNSTRSYNSSVAYAQSKLANLLFCEHLAKVLQGTRVTVNSIHPGMVETDLMRHIDSPNGDKFWKAIKFLSLLPLLNKLTNIKQPQHGAQTSIYCAIAPELEHVTGGFFTDCHQTKMPSVGHTEADGTRLWKISMDMCSGHLPNKL